ncbi:hypothetical protein [Pacificibacter marinus]|uniref:hypothetical protein n=1 Tax=Pacificibacter marinus TaxID=658057 RepID=UPI001C068080|nr:hypothetical protein [Pacificibacter marinus]MBU2866617.1 hypothetical protein [Pacificibacter marinus]
MTHTFIPPRLIAAALALAVLPMSANAACYAEYKAKRDNPLKLHYGIAEVLDAQCNASAAQAALAPRLAADGWVLLSVVGFVDEAALQGKKESAGSYFLRY